MSKLGHIIGLVLLVAIFLALTAMIVAAAPYMALLVLLGVAWFLTPKSDATN
jgi:hypothetical protein